MRKLIGNLQMRMHELNYLGFIRHLRIDLTLERIVEAVHLAPTGTGSRTTGVIIIDESEKLKTLSELVYQKYEGLAKALKNPIGRLIVRRNAGKKRFNDLQSFVMPGMRWYIRWHA